MDIITASYENHSRLESTRPFGIWIGPNTKDLPSYGYHLERSGLWKIMVCMDKTLFGVMMYMSIAMLSYNKEIKDFSISASAVGWGHTNKSETEKLMDKSNLFFLIRWIIWLPAINFFDPKAMWGNSSVNTYTKFSDWNKGVFFTGQVGYKDYVLFGRKLSSRLVPGFQTIRISGLLPIITVIFLLEPIH